MSTAPDLLTHFRDLEKRLEAEPEDVTGEIARGVYLMSPRPRPVHAAIQVRLASELHQRFGLPKGSDPPDWLFLLEPELRSEGAFSRCVPDLAGWRRSATGWPDPKTTPVTLMPELVVEILSPSTAKTDRTEKSSAYGMMGIGWLWLIDPERETVETFINVRGRMQPGPVFNAGQAISAEPFLPSPFPAERLFR